MPKPQSKPYKLSTASLPPSAFSERHHPLNPSGTTRHQHSLGDATGLRQLGVHMCRVPPGETTTVVHWHSADDEWFHILEAGPGARLIIRDDAEGFTREEDIQKGDFLGFPAGVKRGHALRAGEGELVYLMGGTRKELDLCVYPELGKTLVIERAGVMEDFFVKDAHKER